jgi:hypothetical protein
MAKELRLVDSAWPKRCACGQTWNEVEWSRLHAVGELQEDEGVLEMRVCTCCSTISRLRAFHAPEI